MGLDTACRISAIFFFFFFFFFCHFYKENKFCDPVCFKVKPEKKDFAFNGSKLFPFRVAKAISTELSTLKMYKYPLISE